MAQICVNDTPLYAESFAYDGCHKIYLCESKADEAAATLSGYDIYPIKQLEEKFQDSCCLRFINNWSLTKRFVRQGEKATFKQI